MIALPKKFVGAERGYPGGTPGSPSPGQKRGPLMVEPGGPERKKEGPILLTPLPARRGLSQPQLAAQLAQDVGVADQGPDELRERQGPQVHRALDQVGDR